MNTDEVRHDPLTGVVSIHPDQRNKPFPVVRRTLPGPGGRCVFCELAAASVSDQNDIRNGDHVSHLQRISPHSFVIANRWSPFGPSGGAELVITRRHVTDFESLQAGESGDFLAALLEVRARHHDEFRRTLAFVNVGLEVNGTQPHLHGQVVSTNFDVPAPVATTVIANSLDKDVALAHEHGLVIIVRAGDLRRMGTYDDRRDSNYCAGSPDSRHGPPPRSHRPRARLRHSRL